MDVSHQKISVETKDGVELALWRIAANNTTHSKHIFLTHGAFSNKRICTGIAEYFAKAGYVCWIMEWRNHGESGYSKEHYDMEAVALLDVKSCLDYLFNELEVKALDCITHSGGGIALTIFLSHYPAYQNKLGRIVLFACQTFGAGYSKFNYFRVFAGKYLSALLGFVPGVLLGLGVQNEPYRMMKPWFNWNLRKQFRGTDGLDFLVQMKLIATPVLAVCGGGDRFAAPKEGCQLYLDAFQNNNNKLLHCSIKNGFKEDYDHGRIILSRNAAKEVWPLVKHWLES